MACTVAATVCATACLSLCSAATSNYIRECLGSNWHCWDGGAFRCSNQSWLYFELLHVGHLSPLPSTMASEDELGSHAAVGWHQSVAVSLEVEASYGHGRIEHVHNSLLCSSFVRRGVRRRWMLCHGAECGSRQAVRALDLDLVCLSLGAWALTAFLSQRGMPLYRTDSAWLPRSWLHFLGPNRRTVSLMSKTSPFHFSIWIFAATRILDVQYTKSTRTSVSSLRIRLIWAPSAAAFSM